MGRRQRGERAIVSWHGKPREKRVGWRLCLRINQANYRIDPRQLITPKHEQRHCTFLGFVSLHLFYVTYSTRRPMRRSMLCQLFECCNSCSFVWAFFSVSLRLPLHVKYLRIFICSFLLVVSSPTASLFRCPLPQSEPTLYATTILMTAAVFCHSQVDPWAFHRLAERERKYTEQSSTYPIDTNKEGIITTRRGGFGGSAAIDLRI